MWSIPAVWTAADEGRDAQIVTILYDLETAEGVIWAYQMPPFTFKGIAFPAGSWILVDQRTGERRPMADDQFRPLAVEYGYEAVKHLDRAEAGRAAKAVRR